MQLLANEAVGWEPHPRLSTRRYDMNISEETKIHDLLASYPFLEDFLVARNNRYGGLKNPLMRHTIGRVATLKRVAGIGGEETAALLGALRHEIDRMKQAGFQAFIGKKYVDPDKLGKLKEIVIALHEGDDPELLKKRFTALVQSVTATEIADLEQSLIDDGMPEQEVRRLCDLHVAMFEDALDSHAVPDMPPGHPVHTFMLENRIAEGIIEKLVSLRRECGEPPEPAALQAKRERFSILLAELDEITVHYSRKENQLFPLLEKHGVTGPSRVMWSIHDDIRGLLKQVRAALDANRLDELVYSLKEVVEAITSMIYKEEHILLPMSLDILSKDDWDTVRRGENAIGFAWISPPAMEKGERPETAPTAAEGKLAMATGLLDLAQVNLMLTNLPVDISFVDENDRVIYYSDCPERIFPRSPAVIGRAIQNCHPAESVANVNRILNAFRKGEQKSAEFWIDFGGKFILIQYFALVDGNGGYRGCLEVSQDITRIKGLTGEKRLLDWQ